MRFLSETYMYVHIRKRLSVLLLQQCILLIVVRLGQHISYVGIGYRPPLRSNKPTFQGLKLDTHLLIFAYLYCTAHVLTYTFTRSLNTF